MTRDEVLEHIHQHAQWTSWIADDGCRSSGPSSYKQYLAKFAEGMRDLMRGDGLVPAEEITFDVYLRYANQQLWSNEELLRSSDLRVVRDVEYETLSRADWYAKWQNIDLPGDEVTR